MFEHVDWSKRGAYMERKHGVTVGMATEAIGDPSRVVIEPDYNSRSGESVRIVGYSVSAGEILSVIVLVHNGVVYGVNGWPSNTKDRRIYGAG